MTVTLTAQLIYRGIAHSGATGARPAMAQDLVYRGVRHDGLALAIAPRRQDMPLRYRGVAHTIPAPISATLPGTERSEPVPGEMDMPYKMAV